MSTSAEIIDALNATEPEPVPTDSYIPPKSVTVGPINRVLYDNPATLVADGVKDFSTGNKVNCRWSVTRSGFLSGEVAIKLTEGDFAGRWIFHRFNLSPYQSGDRKGMNSALDFLRGVGVESDLNNNTDFGTAVDALIANEQVFKINVDGEFYCNPRSSEYTGCGTTHKYLNKLAKNGLLEKNADGSFPTALVCNDPSHDDDERPTLEMRNIITGFSPA